MMQIRFFEKHFNHLLQHIIHGYSGIVKGAWNNMLILPTVKAIMF